MITNLNKLADDLRKYLEEQGVAIFQSYPRMLPEMESAAVYWDVAQFPDYRPFVAAGLASGVRMMAFHRRQFSVDAVEESLDQLPESGLDRDRRWAIETRLRELRAYAGFVCQVELSFDLDRRTYVFELRTEWYEEMLDLATEIEESFQSSEDENPLAGYYSNN